MFLSPLAEMFQTSRPAIFNSLILQFERSSSFRVNLSLFLVQQMKQLSYGKSRSAGTQSQIRSHANSEIDNSGKHIRSHSSKLASVRNRLEFGSMFSSVIFFYHHNGLILQSSSPSEIMLLLASASLPRSLLPFSRTCTAMIS